MMKKFTRFAVLSCAVCSVLTPALAAPELPNARLHKIDAEAAPIADLIRQLTAPELSWEARFKVEEQLKTLDSQAVLLAIMPFAAQGMPWDGNGGIWNGSGSARGDSEAPPEWQIFYGVNRVWRHHDKVLLHTNMARLAPVQRQILSYVSSDFASRDWAILQLEISPQELWTNEAEKTLVDLMRSLKTGNDMRVRVINCLIRKPPNKYYAEMKAIFRSYPENNWQEIHLKAEGLKSLLYPASFQENAKTGQLGPDADLLKIAFELLPKMEKNRKGSGYFLALQIGHYLGQDFLVSQEDPNFVANTTVKALKWWKKNHTEK